MVYWSQYFMVISFMNSKELMESIILSDQFKKIIKRYKKWNTQSRFIAMVSC